MFAHLLEMEYKRIHFFFSAFTSNDAVEQVYELMLRVIRKIAFHIFYRSCKQD